MKNRNRRSAARSQAESATAFAIAAQAGLGIVLPLVAGGFIGWYLDGHAFHNHVYIATLIGLLLGLFVGVYGLIRLLRLLR
jgi:F0F1-type ATP synthase assembly protein I